VAPGGVPQSALRVAVAMVVVRILDALATTDGGGVLWIALGFQGLSAG